MVDALCNECGNVRTAKAIYFSRTADCRPLKCEGACGRATKHYRAPALGSSRTGVKASTLTGPGENTRR